MKKRMLALLLAGVLSLAVTACGGADSGAAAAGSRPQTADAVEEGPADQPEESEAEETEAEETEDANVLTTALKNSKAAESMEVQMVMDMAMEGTQDDETESFSSIITMDMTCISDPWKIRMEMSVDAGEAGSMENAMVIYGEVDEDGTATMYLYDGSAWQSQVVGVRDLEEYDASNQILAFIDDSVAYELEGMEEVKGANAYKYAYTMSGEEAKEAILSAGALDSLASAGLDISEVEASLDEVGDITEYVWIDETNLYPVKYEMDMSEAMDALMAGMISGMGEEADGLELRIPRMVITLNCSQFNSAEDFTIPGEAKN